MMVLAVGPSMWRVGCVSSAMISICRADAQNARPYRGHRILGLG